jgi:hypothetical protein
MVPVDTSAPDSVQYGRGGKSYFGEVYGLGVRLNDRIYMSTVCKSPASYDKDSAYRKHLDSLRPNAKRTLYSPLTNQGASHTYDTLSDLRCNPPLAYAPFQGDLSSLAGYQASDTVKGFTVAAYFHSNPPPDSATVNLAVQQYQAKFKWLGLADLHFANLDYPPIGAIFVVPVIKTGKIFLRLEAVATRIQGNWMLCRPEALNLSDTIKME